MEWIELVLITEGLSTWINEFKKEMMLWLDNEEIINRTGVYLKTKKMI